MYLFGQQLLTESVKCDELPCKDPSIHEALGHQHYFADQLKVRHHHGTRSVGDGKEGRAQRNTAWIGSKGENQFTEVPEQSLEVLWKLSPTSVAWIHRDEDANRRTEIHIFSQEVKPFFLIPNGILDAFDLHILKREALSLKLWIFGRKENIQINDVTRAN